MGHDPDRRPDGFHEWGPCPIQRILPRCIGKKVTIDDRDVSFDPGMCASGRCILIPSRVASPLLSRTLVSEDLTRYLEYVRRHALLSV